MLPNSDTLVFASSGIPSPLFPSSPLLPGITSPFRETLGVVTSLCQHPLRHCVLSTPWFVVHTPFAATCFLVQPSGFSLLAISWWLIFVAAWERPFSCLPPLLGYLGTTGSCWIFYYRHHFFKAKKKKKEKCHVVIVPFFSTEGSVQIKPFTECPEGAIVFWCPWVKKAITHVVLLQIQVLN